MRMIKIIPLLTTVFLAGCGQAFIDGPLEKQTIPTSKVEVVMWHTYSEEETKVFENEVIPEFERLHPDIIVTPVRQPYNYRLKDALISRSFSDKTPDLVRMDIIWSPEFADLGLLYPLSRFSDFETVKQKLVAPTLETNQYQGQYYGLPLNMTTKIAIYNKQMLRLSGYAAPPTTMSGLREAADVYHDILGMQGGAMWNYGPYFIGLGGKLLNESNTAALGYLNSKESIWAVEQMKDMLFQGTFRISYLLNREDSWGNVIQGKLFMLDEGPWFFSSQASAAGLKESILDKTLPALFQVYPL
ncbi:extracellular solute-binding protein [Paenibacillus hexagrammi]|uniref:extracellular solute-binding protein n=1 Tax=Paenibacillus hexagrammi TaxID=2908839 RepID=UPI0021A2E961|nr:extracellular solute-binding protein [Paenibacillus sp. YPD9-1]